MKLKKVPTNPRAAVALKSGGHLKMESFTSKCGLHMMYSEHPRTGGTLSVSWRGRGALNDGEIEYLRNRFFEEREVSITPMMLSKGIYLVEKSVGGKKGMIQAAKNFLSKVAPTEKKMVDFVDRPHEVVKKKFADWVATAGHLTKPGIQKLLTRDNFPWAGDYDIWRDYFLQSTGEGFNPEECGTIGAVLKKWVEYVGSQKGEENGNTQNDSD